MSAIISFMSLLLFLAATLFTGIHARCSSTFEVSVVHKAPIHGHYVDVQCLFVRDNDNNVWTAPFSSFSNSLKFEYPGGTIGAEGFFNLENKSERLVILSNQPVKVVPIGSTPEGFYHYGFTVSPEEPYTLKWHGLSQFYACVPKNQPDGEKKAQVMWLDAPIDPTHQFEFCQEISIEAKPFGAVPPCILGVRDQRTPF